MEDNNQQGQMPQASPAPQMKLPQNEYTKMDEKTMATIKASAIWNTVSTIITSIASMVSAYYFYRSFTTSMFGSYGTYLNGYLDQTSPQFINVGALVGAAIWGAISGAIFGWILAKFYPVLFGWQKKFLGNKLNSFFKMMFWPYLLGFAISLIMAGALTMLSSSFFIFIIQAVVDFAAIYIYAKMMDKAVGKYYA